MIGLRGNIPMMRSRNQSLAASLDRESEVYCLYVRPIFAAARSPNRVGELPGFPGIFRCDDRPDQRGAEAKNNTKNKPFHTGSMASRRFNCNCSNWKYASALS